MLYLIQITIWIGSAQLSNLENDLGMLLGSCYLTITANVILQKLVEPRGDRPFSIRYLLRVPYI